jgi:hypothetical protein
MATLFFYPVNQTIVWRRENREEFLILDAYLDVEAVEAAEAQIDQFIEKRAREKADANRIEAEWALSERRHVQRRQERLREEWRSYHLEQAECLERTAAELAAEHRARAEALAGSEAV